VEMAAVAGLTIVSTETVVSHEEVLSREADVVGLSVDHVVHVPGGAWPTSCHPAYPLDGDAFLEYLVACEEGRFHEFIHDMGRGQGAA
jgi:glutaconate CoA-transferase subunit A